MKIRNKKVLPLLAGIGMSLASAMPSFAVEGDNSALNKPENRPTAVTADAQGNSAQDIKLVAQIRSAIVSDKSLSTDAHNVKIVTSEGKVTLAGAVKDSAEMKKVEKIAEKIAGANNVQSHLSLAKY